MANLLLVIIFVSVVNYLPKKNQTILGAEIQNQQKVEPVSERINSNIPTNNGIGTTIQQDAKTQVMPTEKPVKKTKPIPTPTPTAKPSKPQCLIKIDGVVYDLQSFRSQHGGGDIFQCGTDMTSVFYNQHLSSYLQFISRYRI